MSTPWRAATFRSRPKHPQLLFGYMFEDSAVELSCFSPGGHVFCIASAGCTAIQISAHGHQVTAVDINPQQIEYVRRRLAGDPPHEGTADRYLGLGRAILPLLGVRRADLQTFLAMDDPADQLRFWRERLRTPTFRLALSILLSRITLRLAYASPFLRGLPRSFASRIQQLLERGFARHPNRGNPFAWRLFLGMDPPGYDRLVPQNGSIQLASADAVDYLESCPKGSFDAFTLSNIVDGAGSDFRNRLLTAVRRSARTGAVAILRSFGEPVTPEAAEMAARDRALIWGSIDVLRVG